MSDSQQIIDVDLDPIGYAPRADLYVRNLSPNTITFNLGQVKWALPPWPDVNYEQTLPWTVARSAGFERLWDRVQVLVAIDSDFQYVIHELPENSSLFKPFVFRQTEPQAVVDVRHNLSRNGPMMVTVFSLDGQTEYFNFHTEMIDGQTVRISFDDPISFQATVF